MHLICVAEHICIVLQKPAQRRYFNNFPPSAKIKRNLYETGFDASLEIDLFGGKRRAVEAASAEIDAAVKNQRDVLIKLLAEVARKYI